MSNEPGSERIVAVETSSRTGSVALAVGERVVDEITFAATLNHGVELLPTIAELAGRQGWSPDGIDHVYVSAGPGSFTGLRIGVTVARTLAMSVDAKVVAVPTVDVIAANAVEAAEPPAYLAVVLDAKRGQVYAALFEQTQLGGNYVKTMDACVIDPAELLAGAPRPLAVMGEGVEYHRKALLVDGIAELPEELARPRATTVHRLGWALARAEEFADPRSLIPIYLRRPEAEEVWERRFGK